MPESRDRLTRPFDVAAVFAQRRSGILAILQDESDTGPNLFGSPVRRGLTFIPATHEPVGLGATRGSGVGRGGFRTPRAGIGRGRNLYGSQAMGRENTPVGSARRGRGRSTNSVLPSWYPRTPLRDITAVVRAIERRRARLGEVEGQQIESPRPQDQRVNDSFMPLSGAQLEHDVSMVSPIPTVAINHGPTSVGKVPKILLDVTNHKSGESEFLTPQKKLLNSIDAVEKVVMEELKKLKRTPTAKKAEREKRVRTLMSMR